jgi:hypothetical protein
VRNNPVLIVDKKKDGEEKDLNNQCFKVGLNKGTCDISPETWFPVTYFNSET